MVAKVRISVVVSETAWRRLRDLAETDRAATGRASVNAIVVRLIERELSMPRPAQAKA